MFDVHVPSLRPLALAAAVCLLTPALPATAGYHTVDSAPTTMDTRDPLDTTTLEGPTSVEEWGTCTYRLIGRFTAGPDQDLTARATWRIVGAAPAGTVLNANVLRAGDVDTTTSITLRAVFDYYGDVRTNDLALSVHAPFAASASASSAPTTMDTRDPLDTTTLEGPTSVEEWGTCTYRLIGRFAAGPDQDLTARATWRIVGAAPAGTVLNANVLRAGDVDVATTITLRAVFDYYGDVRTNDLALSIHPPLAASASASSAPTTMDTRDPLDTTTLEGPTSVEEWGTCTYRLIGRFTAGPDQDLTARATWRIVGAAPAGTVLNANVLRAGDVDVATTIMLRAVFDYYGDVRTNELVVSVHPPLAGYGFADSAPTTMDTRDYLLVITSDHGIPIPPVGTNAYAYGATITNAVTITAGEAQTSTDGRLGLGTAGHGDSSDTWVFSVIKNGDTYRTWYAGGTEANARIFLATSPDGLHWAKRNNGIPPPSDLRSTDGRIPLGTAVAGDSQNVHRPCVIKDGVGYTMWYGGHSESTWRIYRATSDDGRIWMKTDNSTPGSSDSVATGGRVPLGLPGAGDSISVYGASVLLDGGTYRMWYSGSDGQHWRIYYATSPDGLVWTKFNNTTPPASDGTSTDGRIPLGTSGRGDDDHVWIPSVMKDDGSYTMWYIGHDGGITRVFRATSPDGLTWTKTDNTVPVVSDTSSTNGRVSQGTRGDAEAIGSVTVIRDESAYKLWYSARPSRYAGSCTYHATSPDGLTWTKVNNAIPQTHDAADRTRWVCTGWTGTGSVPPHGGTTNVTFVITNDSTITWQWLAEHEMELSARPNGSVNGGAVNGWHTNGAQLTIEATPDAYCAFTHWSGDVPAGSETNNPLTVTMDRPRTITAHFTDDPDGDGLRDAWEMAEFGDLDETADGDPDGDGATNLEEQEAGTDPESASSAPGLIAYYPFSGNAQDASGNGHNGSVSSATLTTDGRGNASSAYAFNDWAAIYASGIGLANTSFTVCAWVKRASDSPADPIVIGQGWASSERGLRFGYDVGGGTRMLFGFYNDDLTVAVPDQTMKDIGEWHHLCGTYDAATRARRLYRDGVLVGGDTAAAHYQGSGDLTIGDQSFIGSRYFHGKIDEVRVYGRALPSNEVEAVSRLNAPPALDVAAVPAPHGAPAPDAYGRTYYEVGTLVASAVPLHADETGGVRWACAGWTGTGSVPPGGGTTNVSFTITQDSTLTWRWAPEYRLACGMSQSEDGSVNSVDGWYTNGAIVSITATPAPYRFLDHWAGDVPAGWERAGGGPDVDEGDMFGLNVSELGDVDGDGVPDVLVGARLDDDGDVKAGAVYVLFMETNGTVRAHQKISATEGGGPALERGDNFGNGGSIGDFDRDGVVDLAIGAHYDDTAHDGAGAIHLLFLQTNGTVKFSRKIAEGVGGGPDLDEHDHFGCDTTLIGDLDGDTVPDLAVGAFGDDDGGDAAGAVYILFMRGSGTVRAIQKISATQGGGPSLGTTNWFGYAVAGISDLDGDGRRELVVGALRDNDGAEGAGALYVLFLNADGTVREYQKISGTQGNGPELEAGSLFGTRISAVGDFDGDGVDEVAVGAHGDSTFGPGAGCVYLLYLNSNGTVRTHQRIPASAAESPQLLPGDRFSGAGGIGDLNADGVPDLAVGAWEADSGFTTNAGAVYICFLNTNGTVKGVQRIAEANNPLPVVMNRPRTITAVFRDTRNYEFVIAGDPAEYSTPTPLGYGTYRFDYGTVVTNRVVSPVLPIAGTNGRIPLGTAGRGDDGFITALYVMQTGNGYRMFYNGSDGATILVYSATSSDGLKWGKVDNSVPPVSDDASTLGRIPTGSAGRGDSDMTGRPSVVWNGEHYMMWYYGSANGTKSIFCATSSDAATWVKVDNTAPAHSDSVSTNGRIGPGTPGHADSDSVLHPYVILDDGLFRMWYVGKSGSTYTILYATSSNGMDWVKFDNTAPLRSNTTSTNGRLGQGLSGRGDVGFVHSPCVIKDGGTYRMWYTGYDGGGGYRAFMATSPDGLTWTKVNNSTPPPSDDTSTDGRIPFGDVGAGDGGGAEAPSVIRDANGYQMWYVGSGAGSARIYHATSPDGLTWTKTDNTIPAPADSVGGVRYACTGWTGTGCVPVAGTPNVVVATITNDSTLTWQWVTEYELTVATSGSGTVDVASGWYTNGAVVTLTAIPAEGQHFSRWTGDVPGGTTTNNPLGIALDGPHAVTADFAPDFVYDQAFVVSGSPTAHGVSAPYGYGTNWLALGQTVSNSVTSPADAADGTRWVCRGWTGTGDVPPGGGTTNVSFTVTTNSTLTWLWEAEYELGVGVSGSGSVGAVDGWYAAGSSVVVTATPAANHHFVEWTGDVSSTNNPLSLTMDRPYSVKASFAIDTYTIMATANDGGWISPSGAVAVAYGEGTSFTFGANANHHMKAVSVNGVSIGLTNAYTFANVTSNQTIRAEFEPDTCELTVSGLPTEHGSSSPYDYGAHGVPWGTVVTIAAASPADESNGMRWVCSGWTGTGSVPPGGGSTNATFTITTHSALTWHWAPEYALDTESAGGGSVTPPDGWYAANARVAITALADPGNALSHWSGDVPPGSAYFGNGPPVAAGARFAFGVAPAGELGGDGLSDVVAGAPYGGLGERGVIHTLFLRDDGTVRDYRAIGSGIGGGPTLSLRDHFGTSLALLGDLDNDGRPELAVGAPEHNAYNPDDGAVYLLSMNTNGTALGYKVLNAASGLDADLEAYDGFGASVAALGDLDGDATEDAAVGATGDDDGGEGAGAVYVLMLAQNGAIRDYVKISAAGGNGPSLDAGDAFGAALADLGRLDGDGVRDLAVGAPGDDDGGIDAGAVHVLFMKADGTVKARTKIGAASGNGPALHAGDRFGASAATLGDLDGDGVGDLAVGAPYDDDGWTNAGAVYILFMQSDGTVKAHHKIRAGGAGELELDPDDRFGASVAALGDLDGDGVADCLVGAPGDDDGADGAGAAYVVFLNADGTVKRLQKISQSNNPLSVTMDRPRVVTAHFGQPGHIALSATNLTIYGWDCLNPSNATFEIWNGASSLPMTYAFDADAAWLSVEPASGECSRERDAITVRATTAGLTGGVYRAAITVSSPEATNSPQTVVVAVDVTPTPTHYADAAGTNPVPPYTSWAHAALTLQDAVDIATVGDRVLVERGVYDSGGRAVYGTMPNRVAIDKPIDVVSVRGPAFARIVGQGPVGPDAVRCVYLADGALLAGFTLTNGFTRGAVSHPFHEQSGGGAWAMSVAGIVSNCVFSGCRASYYGGGLCAGTAVDCVFTNGTADFGGAAAYATLDRCVVNGNRASFEGGGVYKGTLFSTLVVNNTAAREGGGAYDCGVQNCTLSRNMADFGGGASEGTLWNSILYDNRVNTSDTNWHRGRLTQCCTAPLPAAGDNIDDDPRFEDPEAGDYRLGVDSPCIDAGIRREWMSEVTDLDGLPRILNGAVDMGAYEKAFYAAVRVFLQGPFDAAGAGRMAAALPTDGRLPLAAPYAANPAVAGWFPSNTVDWVLLELLGPDHKAVFSRSTLLRTDGYLMSLTGDTNVLVQVSPGDELRLSVKHRNHLGVLSVGSVAFTATTVNHDFTTGPDKVAGGTRATVELAPGIWGMIAGDCDGDGRITPADRAIISNQWGKIGYLCGDLNLDGKVGRGD